VYRVDTAFGRTIQTWSQYQQQARSDILDDSLGKLAMDQ
jgi:hypothetical protein